MSVAFLYKTFNHSELRRIEARAQRRIAQWASEWLNEPEPEAVEIMNAPRAPERFLRTPMELEESALQAQKWGLKTDYFVIDETERVAQALVDSTCRTDIENVLNHHCAGMERLQSAFFSELMECFMDGGSMEDGCFIGEQGDNMEPAGNVAWAGLGRCYQPGSGWLAARVQLRGFEIICFLSGRLVGGHATLNAPPRPSGKQLRGLVLSKPLTLTAKLGEVELRIGEFQTLKTGDVLILDDKVSDKIQLYTSSGDRLCRGSLGKAGEHKAIKVSLR